MMAAVFMVLAECSIRSASRWASSARTELAATLTALLYNGPVHTALDNQSVCDKANCMLARAKAELERIWGEYGDERDATDVRDQPHVKKATEALANISPLRKNWSAQKDGDLWQQYWRMVIAKTPSAVKHRKVKGHADMEMVAKGIISEADREGNRRSDMAASDGTQAIANGTIKVANLYSKREDKYLEIGRKSTR